MIGGRTVSTGTFEQGILPSVLETLTKAILDDVELRDETKPFYLGSMAQHTVMLPASFGDFKHLVIDGENLKDLEESQVVNWCRTAKKLLALKTKGDGNCLVHAISQYLWGVEDSMMVLRRLLCIAMANDTAQVFKERWRREKASNSNMQGLSFTSSDWNNEWEVVLQQVDESVQTGDDRLPYSSLEEIHIFIMANVLRRPIIIACDPVLRSPFGMSIQENNFGGIYLPLLWPAEQCCHYPVVLGYSHSHFFPLVSEEEEMVQREHVIPIVTHNQTPLRLHFLLAEEETAASSLLSRYLKPREIVRTTPSGIDHILVVQLSESSPLPPHVNVVSMFFQRVKNHQTCAKVEGLKHVKSKQPTAPLLDVSPLDEQKQSGTSGPPRPENLPERRADVCTNLSQTSPCKTPGCLWTGKDLHQNFCSKCYLHSGHFKSPAADESMRQVLDLQQQQQQPLESLSEAEDNKHICSSAGCSGSRLKNQYGMCKNCYDRVMKRESVNKEKVEEWLQTVHPARHTTEVNNVEPVGEVVGNSMTEGSVDSQLEESVAAVSVSVEPIFPTGQQQQCVSPSCNNYTHSTQQLCGECLTKLSKPTSGGCLTEDCNFHGSPEFQGFCSKCFTNLSKGSSSVNMMSSAPRRTADCPVGKPCLTSSCSRYGDPAMEGLCSKCYKHKHSAASRVFPPEQHLYQSSRLQTDPRQFPTEQHLYQSSRLQTDPRQFPTEQHLYQSSRLQTDPRQFPTEQHLYQSSRLQTDPRQFPTTINQHPDPCRNASQGCPYVGGIAQHGFCMSCYDRLRGVDVIDNVISY